MSSPDEEEKVEPAFATFTGSGPEYFRIWAVNIVLTVVTLGVYSAWAKVRRTQYFYRHTHIAGSGVDYRGQPIAILKGRLVAAALLWLYSLVGYVNWGVAIAILVALAIALPWLLGQSIRFRLTNTRWRGLPFGFHGTTADAYRVFLLWPLIAVASLFTLFPMWKHRIAAYQFGNASFGNVRGRCMVQVGSFYMAYVMVAALGLVLAVGAVALAFGVGTAFGMPGGLTTYFILYAAIFVGLSAFLSAMIQEATWNATRLGSHRVFLRLQGRQLAAIHVRNLVLTVFTLGLYRPFAQLKVADYYASCIELAPGAPLQDVRRADGVESGAAGEATMDLFNLDVTL